MPQKIAPVPGERGEPRVNQVESNKQLITCFILRGAYHIEQVKEQPEGRLHRLMLSTVGTSSYKPNPPDEVEMGNLQVL